MTENNSRKQQAKLLGFLEKCTRQLVLFLFVFFFIVSVTGHYMVGKKKIGLLQSKSYQGTSVAIKDWLPIDSLHKNACKIVQDSISANSTLELERIEIKKR
jgi:hypothetical protein